MNKQLQDIDSNNMLKKQSFRRPLTVSLVVLGGAMLFLATAAWAGLLLLTLGIAIEIVGIKLKHRN